MQIPKEENTEADKLAQIASAIEVVWKGDLTLLNADARACSLAIYAIDLPKDWRVPIIQVLKSENIMDSSSNLKAKSILAKNFLI